MRENTAPREIRTFKFGIDIALAFSITHFRIFVIRGQWSFTSNMTFYRKIGSQSTYSYFIFSVQVDYDLFYHRLMDFFLKSEVTYQIMCI